MKFVLTLFNMNLMAFWDVTQYSLLYRYELFSRMYCFHLSWRCRMHIALKHLYLSVRLCSVTSQMTAVSAAAAVVVVVILVIIIVIIVVVLGSLSNLKLKCLLFHLYNIYRILCSVHTVKQISSAYIHVH
jgi:hypothetical protein